MNSDYEFLGYIETPNDKYGMLGIATVRLYRKVVIRYKHVKTKDGTGTFFTAASYTYEEGGDKKYSAAFLIDSRAEEEELLEFVRSSVKKKQTATSVHQPRSMDEVAANEQLPF